MQIKIRKVDPAARAPKYQTDGAGGMDICALESGMLRPGERTAVRTGLEVAVPEGYAMLLTPRSGLALRDGVSLINSPGLVDSDYRGEVCALLENRGEHPIHWRAGDRICQAVVVPVVRVEIVMVDDLGETERGRGGFGSTGMD